MEGRLPHRPRAGTARARGAFASARACPAVPAAPELAQRRLSRRLPIVCIAPVSPLVNGYTAGQLCACACTRAATERLGTVVQLLQAGLKMPRLACWSIIMSFWV